MAKQPLVALGVQPSRAFESFAGGQASALGAQRSQAQTEAITQQTAQQALETVGAAAMYAMDGNPNGEVDPQKWDEVVSSLRQMGMDTTNMEGNPAMAPVALRASLSTMQQLQHATNQQRLQFEMDKFDATLAQWATENDLASQRVAQGQAGSFTAPVRGVNPETNEPAYVQFDQFGNRRVSDIEPSTNIKTIDTGTEIVTINSLDGTEIARVPKDVSGEAAEREIGKAAGQAQINLPTARANAEKAITDVDRILNTPGWEKWVGKNAQQGPFTKVLTDEGPYGQAARQLTTQERVDWANLVSKAISDTFSQAYETLKGAGQITEFETASAAKAITNMELAQSPAQFRQAANDFKKAVNAGVKKIEKNAGIGSDNDDDGWVVVGEGVRIREK